MSRRKHDPQYDDRLREIGQRLRAIRSANGLNQEEAAGLVGVTRRQWVSWEAGQVTPSAWALLELMLKIDVDPGWVLDGPGLEPVLRGGDEDNSRFRRQLRAVRAMMSDLGLRIDDISVRRLAIYIVRKPEAEEKERRRDVRELLRGFAIGKEG